MKAFLDWHTDHLEVDVDDPPPIKLKLDCVDEQWVRLTTPVPGRAYSVFMLHHRDDAGAHYHFYAYERA